MTLTKRAQNQPLPNSEIINLKDESRRKGVFYFSDYLVDQLKENFENKKQALIFLNRRGYAAYLSCTSCELPFLCKNCSIAMTWHKKKNMLVCHHCGYTHIYPQNCPDCKGKKFKYEGIGTQRVERDLKILFPNAAFLRMDRDTISRKGALEKSINMINDNAVDFIIGTQLISKGHDFQNIGIVCVVLADMALNIPDFRSSERSFQLISQVSGRAGRTKAGGGLTLIQSYNPAHYAITSARDHDYTGFFEQEIAMREILDNPPFARQIMVRLSDVHPQHVASTARRLGEILQQYAQDGAFQVLGPTESPIIKVNNRFYWQILLKSKRIAPSKRILREILNQRNHWKLKSSTRITVDVDPLVML